MSSILHTCEFVSPRHPDKICDQIADAILDAYIEQDPNSRVAVEVLGGHGQVTICGEITSQAEVNLERLVTAKLPQNYKIDCLIQQQSSDIARGVDSGGAGDQGIMIGYATTETEELMPYDYVATRNLCQQIYQRYSADGKVQITFKDREPWTVVASFQGTVKKDLEALVKSLIEAKHYYINPAGDWWQGGFEADSGLTGRKLVIDNYGPRFAIGGGAFSGKDWTKVDRSGAYMARRLAVEHLHKYGASEAKVQLAYVIGRRQPVMATASLEGGRQQPIKGFDLSPSGIKDYLRLDRPIYQATARDGHFGRGFIWDRPV